MSDKLTNDVAASASVVSVQGPVVDVKFFEGEISPAVYD